MSNSKTDKWPTGISIHARASTLPDDLIQQFRDVPTAHASDCLGRSVGAMGLQSFHGNGPLCGPALTVRIRPGDNLMIHVALSMAEPGDIIVVDGSGDLTQAVVGGLMRTTALVKRIGGFVIDGAVRDIAEFAEGGMPCFARGAVHRGPSKEGPGEINIPISCAGMTVAPGDLIVGDADGVIAIPAHHVAALLPRVKEHAAKEAKQRADILANATDPDRFSAILRAKGVPAGWVRGRSEG